MSRADKIPDPSMEDILASIRKIISDEDKDGTADASSQPPEPAATAGGRKAVASDSRSEDDVFDLTDELIFADSSPASRPESSPSAANRSAAVPEGPPHLNPAFGSDAFRMAQPGGAEAAKPFSSRYSNNGQNARPSLYRDGAKPDRPPGPPVPSTASGQPSNAPRPAWSRRDLPKTAVPTPPLSSGTNGRGEKVPEPGAASGSGNGSALKPWSEDIQMPVPERGPASLMYETQDASYTGSDTAPATLAGGNLFDDTKPGTPHGSFRAPELQGAPEAAASLVQAAIETLDDEELSAAHRLDFDDIGEAETSSVAERLTDALTGVRERANAAAAPFQFQAPRETPPETQMAGGRTGGGNKRATGTYHDESMSAPPETGTDERPAGEESLFTAAFAQTAVTAVRTAERSPQAPRSDATVSAPVLSPAPGGGGTLEDSVREMLRPMLFQWLNDNMPRILESAIRDEIAVRGLLPGSEPGGGTG